MSRSANTQKLDINSPVRINFFLVIQTKFSDVFSANLSVRDVDVLSGDVDVVEKIEIHVVVVRFRVALQYREVLIQVEGYHVLKTESLFLVHSDQLFVNSEGSTPGGQTQHAGLSFIIFSLDFCLDHLGHSQ